MFVNRLTITVENHTCSMMLFCKVFVFQLIVLLTLVRTVFSSFHFRRYFAISA